MANLGRSALTKLNDQFALLAAIILVSAAPAAAQAPKVGDPPEAMNMRLVGHSDLQARSAYMPTIHAKAIATSPMSVTTAAAATFPGR